MSQDPIRKLAQTILSLNKSQLLHLREMLVEEGGNEAGVGAVIPPTLPLKEGGAEAPFEDWPADYFESME